MQPQRNQEQYFQHLAAGHQKMAFLQKDFHRRYMKQIQSLQLQLKQALTIKNNLEKQKIQTGNRLYSAQQQLADSQMAYEKAHENNNITRKLRIESEQRLEHINEEYNSKKQETITSKDKAEKAQKELESMMRHYHEIENYNIQLKSDIAVTRTETFTAEKSVLLLEALKKKQDLLIDSMNEEIKRLEERKNVLAAQTISQKQETEQARKILKEAHNEKSNIDASKKNLLERWQKSLFAMQKMDQVLEKQNIAYKQQKQQFILLKTQYNGLKSQIRKQDAKTERVTTKLSQLEHEKGSLQLKQKELKMAHQNLLMQLSVLRSSLNSTEDEIKKVQLEKKQVDDEMNLIETNIMKLHTETKKLLEELINYKGEHTALEKTTSNLLKQANITAFECEEKEVELEGLRNETARVNIDQLNTKSQIEILESKKKQVTNERLEKQVQVATYEIQIREGHDLNEKKQHEVGRLNKLHDELVSSANDQSKSPLENKHQNLLRQTSEFEQNCNELERDWIKKQTQLVHNNNKLQDMSEIVGSLETKKTILEQKKARLNTNYKGFQKEIATIQINLKGLQNDMNKLNDGLADRGFKKNKLENENFNIESQFGEKLKNLEGSSVKLELGIDRLREEKAELLNQIIECEKHILLWQRKHQLEKEMQDALDPNVGQAEISDLKKEIHRMELKYQSIQKAQNEIQVELLKTSKKQQITKEKYAKRPSMEKKPSTSQPQNKNQFQQSMKQRKLKLDKIIKSTQVLADKGHKIQQDRQKLRQATIAAQDSVRQKEMQNHNLDLDYVYQKSKVEMDKLDVFVAQRTYNTISQIVNKQRRLEFQEPVLRQKLGELREKNNVICECIDEVAEKFPEYVGILGLLARARDVAPNV